MNHHPRCGVCRQCSRSFQVLTQLPEGGKVWSGGSKYDVPLWLDAGERRGPPVPCAPVGVWGDVWTSLLTLPFPHLPSPPSLVAGPRWPESSLSSSHLCTPSPLHLFETSPTSPHGLHGHAEQRCSTRPPMHVPPLHPHENPPPPRPLTCIMSSEHLLLATGSMLCSSPPMHSPHAPPLTPA